MSCKLLQASCSCQRKNKGNNTRVHDHEAGRRLWGPGRPVPEVLFPRGRLPGCQPVPALWHYIMGWQGSAAHGEGEPLGPGHGHVPRPALRHGPEELPPLSSGSCVEILPMGLNKHTPVFFLGLHIFLAFIAAIQLHLFEFRTAFKLLPF